MRNGRLFWIVGSNVMIKDNHQEQYNAHEVGKHSQLDIRNHDYEEISSPAESGM